MPDGSTQHATSKWRVECWKQRLSNTEWSKQATSDSDTQWSSGLHGYSVDCGSCRNLFQRLVYFINLITVVKNVWSYLSVIALILKMPNNAWAECGRAVCQSGGVYGLSSGSVRVSTTLRMHLFVDLEMIKSTVTMTHGGPRIGLDAIQAKMLHCGR